MIELPPIAPSIRVGEVGKQPLSPSVTHLFHVVQEPAIDHWLSQRNEPSDLLVLDALLLVSFPHTEPCDAIDGLDVLQPELSNLIDGCSRVEPEDRPKPPTGVFRRPFWELDLIENHLQLGVGERRACVFRVWRSDRPDACQWVRGQVPAPTKEAWDTLKRLQCLAIVQAADVTASPKQGRLNLANASRAR